MYGLTMARSAVTTLQITQKPPENGPGFDGLDADGDGGVTYEEFWSAAQAKRNGGVLTVSSSVAQSSIQAVSVSSEDRFLNRLGSVKAGFDARAAFEEAMAAIDAAASGYTSVSVEVEQDAGLDGSEPMDAETADLRARALAAANEPVETGLPSLDPYERAAERIFAVADSDHDGLMSRSEFYAMKNALYGGGRTVASRVTVTAASGYAVSAQAGALPGYSGLTLRS